MTLDELIEALQEHKKFASAHGRTEVMLETAQFLWRSLRHIYGTTEGELILSSVEMRPQTDTQEQ